MSLTSFNTSFGGARPKTVEQKNLADKNGTAPVMTESWSDAVERDRKREGVPTCSDCGRTTLTIVRNPSGDLCHACDRSLRKGVRKRKPRA